MDSCLVFLVFSAWLSAVTDALETRGHRGVAFAPLLRTGHARASFRIDLHMSNHREAKLGVILNTDGVSRRGLMQMASLVALSPVAATASNEAPICVRTSLSRVRALSLAVSLALSLPRSFWLAFPPSPACAL